MKQRVLLLLSVLFLNGCDFDPEAMAGGQVNEDDYDNGWSDYGTIYSNHCVLRRSNYKVGNFYNIPAEISDVLYLEPSSEYSLRFSLRPYAGSPEPALEKVSYRFIGWQRTVDASCEVVLPKSADPLYQCKLPYVPGYVGQTARIEALSLSLGTTIVNFVRGGVQEGCRDDYSTTYIDESYQTFPELRAPSN